MKRASLALSLNPGLIFGLLLAISLPSSYARAQASDIPSAGAAPQSSNSQEKQGRILLDQMVAALGGDAWLHRKSMTVRGRTAAFFRGAPNGSVVEYSSIRRFDAGAVGSSRPEAERIGFITDKSILFPGKKTDIVQIWKEDKGYEVTYKGQTMLPKDQVQDYFRRRFHSIESVVDYWLKQPGVMVLAEGTTMVERRMAEKVTVLSANNDAVTLELDASTHLPLRRTFEWRNLQFKDHDEDAEEYDDYHPFDGLPTAMTLTRYHNGDMITQRFYSKVEYNTDVSPGLFNPDNLLKKKQ